MELSAYENYSHKRTPKKNRVDVRLQESCEPKISIESHNTGVAVVIYKLQGDNTCDLLNTIKYTAEMAK